jgi:hypothetical protein
MRCSSSALFLSVIIFLPGCAERATATDAVAVDKRLERVTAQDQPLDCAAIFAEISAHNQTISDLAREQYVKLTQRTYWAGKDLREATGKDIQALLSRQRYLVTLAQQKNCRLPASK